MGRALAILALIAAAGCARSPLVQAPAPPAREELVVLLPGPDGSTGAVSVTHEGQQQTLDAPYAAARVVRQGQLEEAGRLTPEQVRQSFEHALAAQPPRPVTFLLYFLENSDEFTPESKLEIPKIFAEIAAHPSPQIVVVGHTDRVGTVPYNDALSLRRAERVRGQLVQLGIAAERIQAA